MRNILLLTDFSENSINAIRYALHLFEDDICNFNMLYVQKSSSYLVDDFMLAGERSVYDTIIKKPKTQLAKLVVKIENEFNNKNFNFSYLVSYNSLVASVKEIIKSKEIDLIVIGTNGVTGADEVIFGSNTINIIREVDCATLIIPEDYKYIQRPKQILLPLDIDDSVKGNAFIDIIKFTNHFGKKLHLVRIKPNNEDSKEEKNDIRNIDFFLKDTDNEYHIVKNVSMPDVVNCYLQTHNIDLITLIVQKESLFERFITGSPTTKIAHKLSLPLLVFHS
ncbi:universal stress protein [Polaribacter reichenbachii]|uniref:Universal stress protein n=1 Tax=Polaribacter reichenbachii TaxID=996801 RepID=A0A1B8TUZ7_9FLAO|nr:universal stress protein [Polaribacter reichenbachii]APZ45464.1 universal stress protein [Polaribacter reichenbachii]AUC19325.1 universal stress protein [Polaribacter reichenbachii]OBY63521.1 universal stress protein [Polaribacter reichenbachii]